MVRVSKLSVRSHRPGAKVRALMLGGIAGTGVFAAIVCLSTVPIGLLWVALYDHEDDWLRPALGLSTMAATAGGLASGRAVGRDWYQNGRDAF